MRLYFSSIFPVFAILGLCLMAQVSWAQDTALELPGQPLQGPGSSEYLHETVEFLDFAEDPDGYWLFLPQTPVAKKAPVLVFVHGYGAYNPMIYGQWIRHLVRKGNIVIFPRYQENLFAPRPDDFAQNVAQAVLDAQKELETRGELKADWSQLAFIAHSYGGVITSDLAVNYEKYGIPPMVAALLCSPGTGPLSGGRLKTYAEMPSDLKLLIMVSEDDFVVGDEFGLKVFQTAEGVEQRNFIRQYASKRKNQGISSGHNECYSVDEAFDSGVRNFTAKRALRISKLDALDYRGYWKLGDALLNCARSGADCEIAFGDTPAQKSLGEWSDGQALRTLEVLLPQVK